MKKRTIKTTNLASNNATLLHTYNEFEVELWADKHYENRRKYGDETGKRDGIEIGKVQELLIKSFRHLLDIFLRFPRFSFINYTEGSKIINKRLVLKEIKENNVLNIVVEIHYLDTSKYEITIITAMVIDNFKVSDGQYVLIISDNKVSLKRNVNKRLSEIYKLNL